MADSEGMPPEPTESTKLLGDSGHQGHALMPQALDPEKGLDGRHTVSATSPKGGMELDFKDPTLFKGAAAHTLLNNRSEIFASNVLTKEDVADLHKNTSVVERLDDFYSHSWRTSRFDKWAALLMHLNSSAAVIAMVASCAMWGLLEVTGVVPVLLLSKYPDKDGGAQSSGMPMLVGYAFALIFLFNWQQIRTLLGLQPRMCFLDKACIDQDDAVRKSAGIASLGAFLKHSNNFVLLFSEEYFTRLWCCYELAAFHHVRDSTQQKIVFIPVAFPRMLFATALFWFGGCILKPFTGVLAPAVGMSQPDFDNYTMLPGMLLAMWVQYECQQFARQREVIDEQIANFSVHNAECFDPKDRPRVYAEIGKWFGDGDEELGIENFDKYVRTEIRANMQELVGSGECLSAVIPYTFAFLAGCPPIVADIASLTRIPALAPAFRTAAFLGCSTCACVSSPIACQIQLWMANFRFGNGWPMIILSPIVAYCAMYVLIVGILTPDLTLMKIQWCCVVLFGACVFRHSIINTVVGCCGRTDK